MGPSSRTGAAARSAGGPFLVPAGIGSGTNSGKWSGSATTNETV